MHDPRLRLAFGVFNAGYWIAWLLGSIVLGVLPYVGAVAHGSLACLVGTGDELAQVAEHSTREEAAAPSGPVLTQLFKRQANEGVGRHDVAAQRHLRLP